MRYAVSKIGQVDANLVLLESSVLVAQIKEEPGHGRPPRPVSLALTEIGRSIGSARWYPAKHGGLALRKWPDTSSIRGRSDLFRCDGLTQINRRTRCPANNICKG